MKSSLVKKEIGELVCLKPFFLQRECDNNHVKKIMKKYKNDYKKYCNIIEPNIIIIASSNNNLKIKNGYVSKKVVIDGQHRVEALRRLYEKDKKYNKCVFDVKIIHVNNNDEVIDLYSTIAEGKPLSLYERMKKKYLSGNYDFDKEMLNLKELIRALNTKINDIMKEKNIKRKYKHYLYFYRLLEKFMISKKLKKYGINKIYAEDLMVHLKSAIEYCKNDYKVNKKNRKKVYSNDILNKEKIYGDIVYLNCYCNYYGYEFLVNYIESELFDNITDTESVISNSSSDETDDDNKVII